MKSAITELWCSGCQRQHHISAFNRKQAAKSGYQAHCRQSHAKVIAAYRLSEKGRAAIAGYNRSEEGRAARAKYQATINERVSAILGNACAWQDLGGCCGEMEIDHIVAPKRRRTTGYTSVGWALRQWVVANPREAKKKLQVLCACHNMSKSDLPEDVAIDRWLMRHPLIIAA